MYRRIGRLITVLVFEAGTLAWLIQVGRRPWLRIDWSDLGEWLQVTPTQDALVAIIWLVALMCAVWLAASTFLYLTALASRIPALIRSVEWMTLPAIRRVGEGALAALLVTSAAPVPVGAQTPPPVVVVVDEDEALLPPGATLPDAGRVPPLPLLPFEQIERPSPSPILPGSSHPLPGLPNPSGMSEETLSGPAQVVVEAGDNLWAISRRHLTASSAHRPTNEHIARYWRRVIEANRSSLISGDPDLIFPGEVVTLPSPD